MKKAIITLKNPSGDPVEKEVSYNEVPSHPLTTADLGPEVKDVGKLLDANAWKPMGKGILYRTFGDKILLQVDAGANFGPSSSGKTTIKATSAGNQALLDTNSPNTKIGLNIYQQGFKSLT